MHESTEWQLYQLENQGWNYLYSEQILLAQNAFNSGLDLAKKHNNYCMILQFEYHLTQVDVYYTFNQQAAVDRAVRLYTLSKRPEYDNCRMQHRQIHDILLHAYFYRDCLSYESEIRESIRFITEEFQDPYESHLRCEFILCELDFENGNYQAGIDRVSDYISRAEFAHPYRKSDGYSAASRLMYAVGELESARKYAELNVQTSREGMYQPGVAHALLWQAVFSKYTGQNDATRIFEQAQKHIRQYKITATHSLFDAQAIYYELSGELDKAAHILETQLEELPRHGSLHDLVLAHLQYCRFLGCSGKPLEAAINRFREFIATLRNPHLHQEAIQKIENGDYRKFPWQTNSLSDN